MFSGEVAPADALLLIACAIGLLLIPVGLPGVWLVVGAAAAHHFLTRTGEIGLPFLIVAIVLAGLAEIAETLLGVLTARRFGASRRGMWGAFLGGIVGALALSPFFPIVGTLVGGFVGAVAGAFAMEWTQDRDLRRGWRAGLGAFVGRVAAVGLKTAVAVAITVIAFIRIS